MNLRLIVFLLLLSKLCLAQGGYFDFRTEVEIGYLVNRTEYGLHKKPPLLISLKTGVGANINKLTQVGMLINVSFIRFASHLGGPYSLPNTHEGNGGNRFLSQYMAETEGILVGPTLFIEQELSHNFSVSFQSSYLIPATASTERYLYSEELGEVTDRLTSLYLDNSATQLTFQLAFRYLIINNRKIELGLYPFYSYHITFDKEVNDFFLDKGVDNLHYVGLGLNFRLK